MEVTPMSLQMMVPRSAEVGQISSNMNQQVNIQQDYQAVAQKADDRLKETQVRSKEGPEDGRIKDEHQGNSHGAYTGDGGRHHRDEEEEPEEQMARNPNLGSHLDISL